MKWGDQWCSTATEMCMYCIALYGRVVLQPFYNVNAQMQQLASNRPFLHSLDSLWWHIKKRNWLVRDDVFSSLDCQPLCYSHSFGRSLECNLIFHRLFWLIILIGLFSLALIIRKVQSVLILSEQTNRIRKKSLLSASWWWWWRRTSAAHLYQINHNNNI